MSIVKLLTMTFALAILFPGQQPLHARSIDKSVDEFIKTEMTKRRIPGLALAVIRNEKTVKIAGYGQANIEFGVRASPKTLFNVASISKSFTAVGIMTLVESGKLNLDDTIGKYLELPESWRAITIRRLLNHTSGLPDIAIDQFSADSIANTTDEAISLLRDRPMDFLTGAEYRYNQTNYMLLGMLIEKLSGQSFSHFCTEKLFKPLKISGPTFGDVRVLVRNRASVYTIYRFDGNRPRVLDHIEVLNYKMASMTYPGGGLNISAADFSAWLIGLLSEKLITKASLQEIWTPALLSNGSAYERTATASLWRSYGLGWILSRETTNPFSGGTGGLRAAFFVYPDDKLAVIVLTNLQGSAPESLVDGVARRYSSS